MSLASELVVAIRATIAQLFTSRKTLGSARERFTEAMAIVQRATDGASDRRPVEAVMSYQAGIERLNEAEQRISAAEDALKEYAAEVFGTDEGTTSAPPPHWRSPARRPSSSDSGSEFRPGQVHERLRGVIERIGWPKKPNGATDARGLLADATGRPLFRATLFAARDGPANDTSDLKEPWRSSDLTTRFHIEGNVAAHMRRNGIREAVLYLNTNVCGSRGAGGWPDPRRCLANLADHLPVGTTLYTHVILENGSTRSRRFTGTGRALKDG